MTRFTEAQIKLMAERFLSWKLPENFNPDGGISFAPEYKTLDGTARHEPTGTNLLDYSQAEAMVRHMLASQPVTTWSSPTLERAYDAVEKLRAGRASKRCRSHAESGPDPTLRKAARTLRQASSFPWEDSIMNGSDIKPESQAGKPSSPSVSIPIAELRVAIQRGLLAELGDTYDCTRVWSAWGIGTMDQDDFVPVLDRLEELIDTIVTEIAVPTVEWEGDLTPEETAMIDRAWERHVAAGPQCEFPPEGWVCTRGAGHDGPCAALHKGASS